MPGAPGNFGDHAQIDEPQAHRADDVTLHRVIELVTGSRFLRAPARDGAVFGDRRSEAPAVSDAEARISALRGAVAVSEAQTAQGALEPDPFGDRAQCLSSAMGVVKDGTRLSCASASERSSNACTNSARFKLGLSSSSSRP